MNPWMRNEPLDTDVSGTAQFEGRTAEEAVARARAALGDAGALRCWKTRRGGVGGFFAKEVFVAGLTPPPGSETTRSKASRAEPDEARGGSDRDPVPRAAPSDGTIRAADHLSGLVEATSDQVSLRSLAIPAEAFDEVLAEAEAALTREREGNGVTIPRALENPLPQTFATEEPGVSEPEPALPDDGGAGVPPDRGDDAIAASRTGVVRRWRAAGIGTARQEGIPTEAKGRTHATSAPIYDGSEARTAQSSGAHPRSETRASQPGRPRLVPAARTAPVAGPAGHRHGDVARAAGAADPHRGCGGGRGFRTEP